MRPCRDVVGWLMAVVLTGCVASQPGGPTGLRPATDVLLNAGDIQVAQAHLRAFGFDPGPVVGVFTPETRGRGTGLPGPLWHTRQWPPGSCDPARGCSRDLIR